MARTPSISKLDQYIKSLYAQEDETLAAIRNSLDEYQQTIQVSPIEGKIINLLIKLSGAVKVLEIGTLGGYSATWIARALPENGKLICLEKSESNFQISKTNLSKSDVAHKVEIRNVDATVAIKTFSNAEFDAVFIDADKASYPIYLNESHRILKPGGLLIADNTLLFGNVYDQSTKEAPQKLIQAMKEFNLMLADSSKFESIMLPTPEGLSVAIRV